MVSVKIGNIIYSVVMIILGMEFKINPNLLVYYLRYALKRDSEYIGEIIIIFVVFVVMYGLNKLFNVVGEKPGK